MGHIRGYGSRLDPYHSPTHLAPWQKVAAHPAASTFHGSSADSRVPHLGLSVTTVDRGKPLIFETVVSPWFGDVFDQF